MTMMRRRKYRLQVAASIFAPHPLVMYMQEMSTWSTSIRVCLKTKVLKTSNFGADVGTSLPRVCYDVRNK